MIQALTSIPVVAAGVAGLVNTLRGSNGAGSGRATANFASHLSDQLRTSEAVKPQSLPAILHRLVALQQAGEHLPLDLQVAFARNLMHRTIQVRDPGGAGVVGPVTDARVQNGLVHLAVNGHYYPISSLQAVLEGIFP